MNNKEISSIISLYAKLAELHGEDSFRTKSYSNAAFQIGKSTEKFEDYDEQEWLAFPGVGKGLVPKLMSLVSTGTFAQLDTYLEQTPKGVLEMLRVKGLGAKKLLVVWKEMEIESVGELLYACKENRLKDAKGFGIKSQTAIQEQIEYLFANANKFLYATAEEAGLKIVEELLALPSCTNASACGAFRRKEVILEKLDFLYAGDMKDLESWANSREDAELSFPIGIHHCEEADFYDELIARTGSEEFLKEIEFGKANYDSEETFFLSKKRNFLPAECRHGREMEKDVIAHNLITYKDIKGVLHNHSTYSDGLHTLKEMGDFVQENGFEYFGISDHSKSAFYANGLQVDRVMKQQQEIDTLNANYTDGFKIYKSIEADILNNGDLDYEDEVLKTFDFVVASVHSNLKMTKEKSHPRLIKAIENPHTRILGHLTTRLLLSREGFEVDHAYIIDACAANGVCIELNANPYRLDIDWQWLPYCMRKEVLISINPDAHKKEGIFDIHYGVHAARKGLLTKDFCLNAKSREEFEKWLKK